MDILEALQHEREAEKDFVELTLRNERAPRGWPAALVMFHVGMWRERLRNMLVDLAAGREPVKPPTDVDAFNVTELANGIGTPIADAAGRCDYLLGELIELYRGIGERPLEWYAARTTTEALLRNSYVHPRNHMYAYLRENGEDAHAFELIEQGLAEMREVQAPALILQSALYNVSCVRAAQGRLDEAIELLRDVLPARPDMKQAAAGDADLAPLREDARFQELVRP